MNSSENTVHLSFIGLVSKREEMLDQIAILKDQIKAFDLEIENVVGKKLKDVRVAQAKDTGAVSIVEDGIKVTETIVKKVEWDLQTMAEIWAMIQDSGDDPSKYIKKTVSYSVSEKEFKKWPDQIRKVFEPARTVKTGSRKLEFKPADAQ